MTQHSDQQPQASYGRSLPLDLGRGPWMRPTAADRRRLETRRRIDDILLAAQIEREALDEVWDHA